MPAITVLLTTFNRSNFLRLAIRSVLNQNFKDFELLICDDASTDDTEKVVRSYQYKRIIYVKNEKNLGVARNFKIGVSKANGKYIFLLSDDDFLLRPDTLSYIFSTMEQKGAAYGRLGVLFYDKDPRKPSFVATPKVAGVLYLTPSEDIIIKTIDWQFGFASGNIYRKDFIKPKDFVDDVWMGHLVPAWKIVKKEGAILFGDYFIVARMGSDGNAVYLNVDVNKGYHMTKMFKKYRQFDSSEERCEILKRKHLDGVVKTFPGIKYYTSNKNVIEIAKEMIKIDTSYKYSPLFWLSFLSALLLPKFILAGVRKIKLDIENIKVQKFLKEIDFQKHIDRLFFK